VHTQTALDGLRDSMLDPDPAKRPSLDSVLMSSYLNDVDRSYTEDDVSTLMRAMTAYNRQVGRDIEKLTSDINYCRGKIGEEEAKFAKLQKAGTPTHEQGQASADTGLEGGDRDQDGRGSSHQRAARCRAADPGGPGRQ
jgi:hypothetical protein